MTEAELKKKCIHYLEHGEVVLGKRMDDIRRTEIISMEWMHESDHYGNRWSRCKKCYGCVDGFVSYPFCPYCGEKMRK